jgi:hypothetical protein
MEALRVLKRRLSDLVHRALLAESKQATTTEERANTFPLSPDPEI